MEKYYLSLLLITLPFIKFNYLVNVSHYIYTKVKFYIGGHQNEIIKNLWLGDHFSSVDTQFLLNNNIQSVFNCTKNLPFTTLPIEKYRIPIDDDRTNFSSDKIKKYSSGFFKTIDEHLEQNNGVLIHCHAGYQRSATFLALYLMKKYNVDFNKVSKIIKNERFFAFFPIPNYSKILKTNDVK